MKSSDDAEVGTQVSDSQIAAFLTATTLRPVSVAELIGTARSLRTHMSHVRIPTEVRGDGLLDTCGTGGSGFETFNTSTASAFVCAAGGIRVAKHGNRASTSKSGSADVLEKLGILLDLNPEQQFSCLEKTNFCFMFAPAHHAATKRVGIIRKQLPFRTLFNLVGPLANPAQAEYQLLGVSDAQAQGKMAEALKALGTKRALVVRGDDGLDEITLSGSTKVVELTSSGEIVEYSISPSDFGYSEVSTTKLGVASAKESAALMRNIFSNKPSAQRDLVAFNSAAAFYVRGIASSIEEGVEKVETLLASNKVNQKLDEIVTFQNEATDQ
ncbi:UNVERIFIED_CONTAM: hypothetical protein GTU68_052917 [Idotea baltica]|nr:hypothetical protein [Idotea baltica]